ncbi:MAG: mevalonate kinase [Bombilactobacillus mellifer]|nr:mevalonate kinase [Bombilactobacillus mellifer]
MAVPIKSLQTKVYISQNLNSGIYLKSKFFFGNLEDCQNILPSLYALIKSFLNYIGNPQANFQVNIQSTIPEASGLGSSAAVAWSLSNALNLFFQTNLSKSELLKFANISEKLIHVNPSGLDLATSSSNNPIIFQRNHKTINLSVASQIKGYLIIATTPKEGITKNAVQKVGQNAQMHPLLYHQYFDQIESITYQAIESLQTGDLINFGTCLNENQKVLSKMNLSTNEIENLIKIANQNGSLGTKITGSGLGGSIFALSSNLKGALNLEKIFRQSQAEFTHIISLSEYGN